MLNLITNNQYTSHSARGGFVVVLGTLTASLVVYCQKAADFSF